MPATLAKPTPWWPGINNDHPQRRGLVWAAVFNEGAGLSVRDLSGQGRNGVLTNMDQKTAWVGSKFGNTINFDGTNDRAVIAENVKATFPPFTVMGRFKSRNGGSAASEGIMSHNTSGGNNGWRIQTGGAANGILTLTFGAVNDYQFTDLVLTTEWMFFAVTVSGTTATGYLDRGVQELTVGTVGSTPTQILVGDVDAFGGLEFDGLIDHIRVYDRVFSREEYNDAFEDPYALFREPDPVELWNVAVAAPSGNPWYYYAQQQAAGAA